MTLNDPTVTLENALNDLQGERDRAMTTYFELANRCLLLELALKQTPQPQDAVAMADPTAHCSDDPEEDDSECAAEGEADASASGYPLDVDVSGASNLIDRLRLLAMRLPQGIFDIDLAALWLREIGSSHAQIASLRSRIYKDVRARDDFTREGLPRTHAQYVGYSDLDTPTLVHFDNARSTL